MNTDKTKLLLSKIIQKPPLTDQLLQRPPFKFIHDVIHETVKATGYLSNDFTADELDNGKMSATRESKIAFLQKVVDFLNFDGTLDQIKPSKIVAGKEPEFTNLLLQKLATEANAYSKANKKTKKTKDGPEKETKEKIVKKSHKSEITSSKTKDKLKDTKEKTAKLEKPDKKPSSKIRKSSKEKTSKDTKKIKHSKNEKDEVSIDSSQITQENNNLYKAQPDSSRSLPERESSGGTSKGGDDSGIAEETGESERHESARRRSPKTKTDIHIMDIKSPEAKANDIPARPTTAAIRPQTSLGRPGTAMTRAAPPKLKRTKIADIDPTTVSAIPSIQNSSLLLEEKLVDEQTKSEVDQFLVEEDEELAFSSSNTVGANVATLNESEQHGHLVKKIIENTRELAKEGIIEEEDGATFDMHEQRRIRLEIESVQGYLQQTTQNVQPLTRTLEFITDDFDTILKEIEENRKSVAHFEQIIQEKNSKNVDEQLFALSAQLRNLDGEINDIKSQIASSMFTVIENENKIQAIFDILFVALDRFNRSVDREHFDRQYYLDLEHLPPPIFSLLSPQDHPPKAVVLACRRIFLPLDII